MAAEVVAEVVVADPDADHVPGEVHVAEGVVLQADRDSAVAPPVLDIGEGTEHLAKAQDVVRLLEGLPAVQQ